MIDDALLTLLLTTFIVAATHTLAPDHWFGFVMLGRTRKWDLPKTLTVAAVAGIGHVGTSIILSLIAIWAGAALAHNFASVAEVITGWAMIFFGVGFAIYAYVKGGHSHHGIPFVNKIFHIDNREAEELMHVHNPCDHGYNPHHDAYDFDHPHGHNHHHDDHDHDHHHDHDHGRMAGTKLDPGYGLVAIIALTPCVLLMPLALRAGEMGMAAVLWTIAVFFIATLAAILILVAAGLKGLRVIRFEFFEKFGEVITGLIIGFMGVMVVAGVI
jgi:nickel/cobalt transporter (NicO) family protein